MTNTTTDKRCGSCGAPLPEDFKGLRDEFACPGMHAEWLDDKTVQCLKELP